ncbi:MAG: septum formation initiator family protein [Desulfotignum sp.]|nr:septum formation initiator family protein [Desulfotignum sp.]MCF8126420.1 septum formation initiator family protein [Desulfotignum sp.]
MGMIEKIGFYLTLGLLVMLLFMIFFSRNGIRDHQLLEAKKKAVVSQVNIARQENKKMERQILRLQKDIEYIKHLAKHEHGMAEPDELIFKQKN